VIRRALHVDQPALEGLIRRQHAASKYAASCDISDKALESTMLGLIAGQGQNSVGASHVAVAEREGKIVGFIAGVLHRIYFIGNKLEAGDLFFVNEGTLADALGLLDSFIAWAKNNPKVLTIKLSWSDTIPGAENVTKLFYRKGLRMCGEVWAVGGGK
jgi:hypothetical protein